MIKYIRTFFGLCNHEYEILDHYKVSKQYSNLPYAFIYVKRCKKCNKLQKNIID